MPWYLAQLKPNGLHRATENLRRQGFGTFMPLRREDVRRNGRFITARKPLFPGYIFVRFDPESDAWRSVNGTLGVARLVAFGDAAPRPVPEGLVAALRARCDEAGMLLPPAAPPPGAAVTILAGPFSSFAATVEQGTDRDRVRVLLDVMGQAVRTELCSGRIGHP